MIHSQHSFLVKRYTGVVYLFLCLIVLGLFPAAYGQTETPLQPERTVKDNILISTALPEIRVQVADAFVYLGKFEFTIKGIAYGERHVFIDESDGKVERLFIFQFEGFLPDNTHTYNYSFAQAETLGGYRFRQNTWAYSNAESELKNPKGEGALTARFVRSKGFELEDELMMSRFLMVPDEARRHEMILFYLENASSTGRAISSFYDEQDKPTSHWRAISEGLTARSRSSFEILAH